MNADEIGFALVASRTLHDDHPGHMSTTFMAPKETVEFRGFVYLLRDLPEGCRSGEPLRNFLFQNRVPGYVVDDFKFADKIREIPEQILCNVFPIRNRDVVTTLHSPETRLAGWYSFNPDDFEECNNCVTWSVATINEAAREVVLSRPRQGRIKLMIAQVCGNQPVTPEAKP